MKREWRRVSTKEAIMRELFYITIIAMLLMFVVGFLSGYAIAAY